MNKCAKVLSYVFWVVATGLYLASMLTNYWIEYASLAIRVHGGLFQRCIDNACSSMGWKTSDASFGDLLKDIFGGNFSNTLNDVPVDIFVTRMLMLAAALLVVLGILIGLCGVCTKSSCPTITEGVLDILGGLIIVGACAYFTVQNNPNVDLGLFSVNTRNFHYSYYFAWISGAVYVVAGVCGIVAGSTDTY